MPIEKYIVEKEFKPKQELKGRVVKWLMTPDTTGGKYSSVCTVEVMPGMRALPAHSHPNGEETIYIASGNGKVLIGDEVGEIKTGSIIFFPQGVPHMLYNTGETILKGICFYAPSLDAISYAYHENVDFPEPFSPIKPVI